MKIATAYDVGDEVFVGIVCVKNGKRDTFMSIYGPHVIDRVDLKGEQKNGDDATITKKYFLPMLNSSAWYDEEFVFDNTTDAVARCQEILDAEIAAKTALEEVALCK